MLWQTNPFSGRLQVFTTNISLKTWSTMDNGNLKQKSRKTPLLSWKSQQMRWPLCDNFKSRDTSPQNIYHQMTFWIVHVCWKFLTVACNLHTLTISYLDIWRIKICENLSEKNANCFLISIFHLKAVWGWATVPSYFWVGSGNAFSLKGK